MVRSTSGVLVALSLALASVASADDGGRAAYTKATRYFEAEEFAAALPWFERAYEQSGHRPATIFGLAQCLRSLKMYERSIGYFEEYLATDPDNRAEVDETLGLLREIAAQQKREREAAAEAERKREAEEAAQRAREDEERADAERRAIAEAEERARAAAEAAIAAQPPPVAITAQVAPPEESSIVSSPVFWILTGAAVVGGAIAVALVATSEPSTYGGTVDVVLEPLGGGR